MKKAMLQAAGTAVLGVALAAAAVTPAAADGLGVDGIPTGALTGAPGGSGTDSSQLLGSQSGSVHTVTGTAQDLVNSAAPSVQNATQAVGRLSQATNVTGQRALPTAGLLPGVDSLPAVSSLPGVSQATQALPVHTPIGGLTG
jgi:hypothetical protein